MRRGIPYIGAAILLLSAEASAAFFSANAHCAVSVPCDYCHLFRVGDYCDRNHFLKTQYFHCDEKTKRVLLDVRAYLECDKDGTIVLLQCQPFSRFSTELQSCIDRKPFSETSTLSSNDVKRVFKRSEGSRTGDLCTYNTDCQSGMYCFNGACTCLSSYVSIAGFCWPKVNPGESGCVEDLQCEAVWPGARCSRGGLCECPEYTLPSKTRDGMVCVTNGVPPACPFPEPNNLEAPNPASMLANSVTHPLAQDTYMPVLCTSTSGEVENSNGGDGSTWCVYPDGDQDVYVADLYNCVPHPQVRSEFFSEYSDTIDGICCHSRAFTCIQPMEQGDEPSVPRWWYNSITGTCVQFLWDPAQSENVSPNNFRTVEHCESYCRDTCRRGPVQFNRNNHGSLLDETPIANCLHQTGSCGPEFHCTLIGSHQNCCPTIGNVCSAHGGRLLYVPRERFDAGVPISGGRSVGRYYYDAEQGKCNTFIYDGLGNYNNFLTKQDCENFCSRLVCEHGNPLRIDEEWQRCESNSECPSSHQCESAHKVCCPTAQSICTQPKRVGDCTSIVRRYWYNAATRQCEMFQYTGCQGNDNNFESLVECQQKCRNVALEPKCPQGRAHRDTISTHFYKCASKTDGHHCPPNHQCHFDGMSHGCCPTKTYTCSLGADRGVQCGSGRSFRYYFNANKQTCESFQYEGCDGNSNNFQSLEECQDYCGVGGCPNGGQPLRDMTTNEYTACDNADGSSSGSRCPETHECVGINFEGSVAHRCCPTKTHVCSLPPQQGSQCTKHSATRWYFNLVTKECAKFSYHGCNGNLNNFASYEQCIGFCSSTACPPGEVTLRDINTKELIDCSPALVNSCPSDYRCRLNSMTGKHVCCGTPPSDVCPAGEKPYVNAFDDSMKECAINSPGSCPLNFLCRFSVSHNRYYCCTAKSGNVCPDGKALYQSMETHRPMRCTLSGAALSAVCEEGFTCQSRVSNVLQGFCCSTNRVCPNGAKFLVDERTLMPRICMEDGFGACEPGYHCHRHGSKPHGYCCKSDDNSLSSAGCPQAEYVYVKDNKVVECDPFNPQDKGCPPKFSCQYTTAFRRYQCCGKELIEAEKPATLAHGCLPGQVAYLQLGATQPQLCTASAQHSCPFGFSCQFSEQNSQFQCCAHKANCPSDTVAYVDEYGSARKCDAGQPVHSQCPVGYSCRVIVPGADSTAICCTLEGADRFVSTPSSMVIAPSIIERQLEIMDKSTRIVDKETAMTTSEAVTKVETDSTTKVADLMRFTSTTTLPALPSSTECKALDGDDTCTLPKLGDFCQTNLECPAATICSHNVCHCPLGTVRNSDNRKCSTSVSIEVPEEEPVVTPSDLPSISATENGSEEDDEKAEKPNKKTDKSDEIDYEDKEEEEKGEEEEVAVESIQQLISRARSGLAGSRSRERKTGFSKNRKLRPFVTTTTAKITTVYEVGDKLCAPNEVLYKGRCLRSGIPLGAVCVISAQCIRGSRCSNKRCKCMKGLAGYNNRCYTNICGSDRYRLPQLTAATNVIKCGRYPQKGINSECKYPHKCGFSKVVHDYICCRSSRVNPLIIAITGSQRRNNTSFTMPPDDISDESAEKKKKSGKGRAFARKNKNSKNHFSTTKKPTEISRTRTETTPHTKIYRRIDAVGKPDDETLKTRRRGKRCPDSMEPFLFPGTTSPVRCFLEGGCPSGYYCIKHICCRRYFHRPIATAAITTISKKPNVVTKNARIWNNRANQQYPSSVPPSVIKLPGISAWKVLAYTNRQKQT